MYKFVSAFLVGVVLLAAVSILSDPPRPKEYRFLMPPKHLKRFTLGYDENIADSMWLRVIQDLDVCELTKNRKDETKAGPIVNVQCRLGWVYHMIDSITELAPRFHSPYFHGALMLTVVVNDNEGSGLIFEKGIKQFPKDWRLQYYAAYLYISELNNKARAADLLVEAGKNGAPEWVNALAGRIYSKLGKAILAKTVLESALERKSDERWEKRIRERLDIVNKELEEAKAESAQDANSAK